MGPCERETARVSVVVSRCEGVVGVYQYTEGQLLSQLVQRTDIVPCHIRYGSEAMV